MINDKMAKMAVNTLKAYCDRKKCSDCAVSKTCDLAHDTFQYFAKYPLVGEFENTQKPLPKDDNLTNIFGIMADESIT